MRRSERGTAGGGEWRAQYLDRYPQDRSFHFEICSESLSHHELSIEVCGLGNSGLKCLVSVSIPKIGLAIPRDPS